MSTTDYGKIGLLLSIELILPFISFMGFERAILRFYDKKEDFVFFNKTISLATLVTHITLLLLLILIALFQVKSLLGLQIFPDLILILLLVYLQGTNLIKFNKFTVNSSHKK